MNGRIDNFRGLHFFLSNFNTNRFVWRDISWWTSEHAFQWAKTDDEVAKLAIQQAASAAEAKRLGRAAPCRSSWESEKLDVMWEILCAKFGQNPSLASNLLATGDSVLIEGNTWHDNFWGTCRCSRCKDNGQNHLGKLLMQLRSGFADVA